MREILTSLTAVERTIQQFFCLVWVCIVLDLFLAVQATLCLGASVTFPPDAGASSALRDLSPHFSAFTAAFSNGRPEPQKRQKIHRCHRKPLISSVKDKERITNLKFRHL